MHKETKEAVRLVREEGKTAYRAAKITGVSQSTISRALKQEICKECGQTIKKKK